MIAGLLHRLIKVVRSGPLFACDAAGQKAGALVVFDVEAVADVHRFNQQGSNILHGIYDCVHVTRWEKTIA